MTDSPSAPAAASTSASATTTAASPPPAAAPKSAAYRSAAHVDDAEDDDDDDDDDLDDLDDVLHSFNAPTSTLGKRAEPSRDAAPPTAAARGAAPGASASAAAGAGAGAAAPGDIDDDEFQAQLMEGMESLLRSLAIDHPPGPMPGTTGSSPAKGAAAPAGGAASGDLSKEDEDKAFQRAVQMMLSGEGMEALGLDQAAAGGAGAGPSTTRAAGTGAGAGAGAGAPKASFDETIRRTMDSLNAGGAGAASTEGMPGDLAALLRQLSEDPSALDALGGGGDDDDDLGGLLDGMMAQLMSKDVLEEPMTELAAKYPAYLASPPAGTTEADLVKYRQQHALVQQILEAFKRPQYSDDVDGKEVAKLVGEMQDLGGPPTEIMGDLPEGFDMGALGGLGGDEGCVVM